MFKKGGCLGTSSIIGLNTSDEDSAQGLQWPASLPQVCHPVPVELLLCLSLVPEPFWVLHGPWLGAQDDGLVHIVFVD